MVRVLKALIRIISGAAVFRSCIASEQCTVHKLTHANDVVYIEATNFCEVLEDALKIMDQHTKLQEELTASYKRNEQIFTKACASNSASESCLELAKAKAHVITGETEIQNIFEQAKLFLQLGEIVSLLVEQDWGDDVACINRSQYAILFIIYWLKGSGNTFLRVATLKGLEGPK